MSTGAGFLNPNSGSVQVCPSWPDTYEVQNWPIGLTILYFDAPSSGLDMQDGKLILKFLPRENYGIWTKVRT